MLVAPRIVVLTAVLGAGCPATLAWSPETRVGMVDQAVRMMPASLRMALETHREELLRGMLTPLVSEDDPLHHAPWNHGGQLDRSVEQAASVLNNALAEARPRFTEVAQLFGELAHYVTDAGFPPGVSREDGPTRYHHFADFCEDRRKRFPLVFYGHEDEALARGDFVTFARNSMQRASDEDRNLARAYAAAGDPPAASAFDDHSVPFAVGSLAYSHSINDVVRAWLAVWGEAGGDTGRTPYLKPTSE